MTLVVCMAAVLLAAMVTVDFSDWYALKHQAQTRADAAALAAANCLAHPDAGPIQCSTPVDTLDATKAARYGAGGAISSVRISGGPTFVYASNNSTVTEVKVTMRSGGAGFLPGLEPKITVTATVSITMPTNGAAGGVSLLS